MRLLKRLKKEKKPYFSPEPKKISKIVRVMIPPEISKNKNEGGYAYSKDYRKFKRKYAKEEIHNIGMNYRGKRIKYWKMVKRGKRRDNGPVINSYIPIYKSPKKSLSKSHRKKSK